MKAPKYARNLLNASLAWLATAKNDMGSELNLLANTARSMAISAELPTVVCLCGSTRFKEEFIKANAKETLAGRIVLSVGHFSRATPDQRRNGLFADITPEQKVALDVLHKRKIDLADEILVVNVGGYVGESTASEIAYALEQGKEVRWLDPVQGEAYLRIGNPFLSAFYGEKAIGSTDAAPRDPRDPKLEKLLDEPTMDDAARKAALKVGAYKVILEDDEHLTVCDEELVIAGAKDGKEHEDALRSFCSSSSIDALLSVILDSLNKAKAG